MEKKKTLKDFLLYTPNACAKNENLFGDQNIVENNRETVKICSQKPKAQVLFLSSYICYFYPYLKFLCVPIELYGKLSLLCLHPVRHFQHAFPLELECIATVSHRLGTHNFDIHCVTKATIPQEHETTNNAGNMF